MVPRKFNVEPPDAMERKKKEGKRVGFFCLLKDNKRPDIFFLSEEGFLFSRGTRRCGLSCPRFSRMEVKQN